MLSHVLFLSSVMVVVTVTIHFFGVTAILAILRARILRFSAPRRLWAQAVLIILSVLALIGLHSVEIWAYALLFLGLGEFPTLEQALYFSTSTFSTVGYGDVVLNDPWRLLAAIESVNGFVLLGWSTAVLVAVIGRMRAVEDRWLAGSGTET